MKRHAYHNKEEDHGDVPDTGVSSKKDLDR